MIYLINLFYQIKKNNWYRYRQYMNNLYKIFWKEKKEIYVDPQYFPPGPDEDDLPPAYNDDEGVDYTLEDDDYKEYILNKLEIPNYDEVEMRLNEAEMTNKKTKAYINKILKDAKKPRNQIKRLKTDVTKKYNSGAISEPERQNRNKGLDNARVLLNEYIKHYENKLKTMKGSGIQGRVRKQRGGKRGGNIMFFNDPKHLVKKLELTVGEILAGNTNIQMRNTGVAILDTLLKTSTINRPQYNKLYNQYFKI